MSDFDIKTHAAPRWRFARAASLTLMALIGCGQGVGKLTKENVSKIQIGTGIADAQLILGTPKNNSTMRPWMDWGEINGPGPYVSVKYDPETKKITSKSVDRVE